jgi:hypothetical protein
MDSTKPFDADIQAALLRFNGEAVLYCRDISEAAAHDYAMNYARMLRNRAKGREVERVQVPAHFFEPNRKAIEAMLEKMYRKYFATYRVARRRQ